MFKKININYLLIFLIFILLTKHIEIPKKIIDILGTRVFNLVLVLFLIRINNNHLSNLLLYLIFLVVLNNQKDYEKFSSVASLEVLQVKTIGELKKLTFSKIMPLKSRIKVNNEKIADINYKINDTNIRIENINAVNLINKDIQTLTVSRNKAVKEELKITKNTLMTRIVEIEKDLNSSRSNISTNKKEIKKLKNLITKSKSNIAGKIPSLISQKMNTGRAEDTATNLQEKYKKEKDSKKKSKLKIIFETARKRSDNEEDKLSKIQNYIDEQKSAISDLEASIKDTNTDTQKSRDKIRKLNFLLSNVKQRIIYFNKNCDEKIDSVKTFLKDYLERLDNNTESNNKKIESLKDTIRSKEEDIKNLEKTNERLQSELEKVNQMKEKIQDRIREIKLKIGEIKNS